MIDLTIYGYHGDPDTETDRAARVTAVHRGRFELITSHGPVYARLKTAAYSAPGAMVPTVGDFVRIQPHDRGDSLILQTLPRTTCFARPDPDKGGGEQYVAANFTHVLVVTSLNQDFNPRRLERYLAMAWQSGATPLVVLTKADLTADWQSKVSLVEAEFPGVSALAVSTVTGQGMEALRPYTQPGKTLVLLGSSGVGKSSLVNALLGETHMEVRAIREDDGRGRHTTTHRQLILLPSGGMVIDTPGIRQIGVLDVSVGLGETFADVEQFLGRCKFRDCAHNGEPGCAVRAAIEAGELSAQRWSRYLQLKREALYNEDRMAYLRARDARIKEISREVRSLKQKNKNRWSGD